MRGASCFTWNISGGCGRLARISGTPTLAGGGLYALKRMFHVEHSAISRSVHDWRRVPRGTNSTAGFARALFWWDLRIRNLLLAHSFHVEQFAPDISLNISAMFHAGHSRSPRHRAKTGDA